MSVCDQFGYYGSQKKNSDLLSWGRAKGAEKPSCGEMVVQRVSFGEPVSPHDAFSAPFGNRAGILSREARTHRVLRRTRWVLPKTRWACFWHKNIGKRFNRSLVRTGVWRGFWNRPRTLRTAERRGKSRKRALLFSAPNLGMHQTQAQKRSENNRLRGARWVLSPEHGEGLKTHWVWFETVLSETVFGPLGALWFGSKKHIKKKKKT